MTAINANMNSTIDWLPLAEADAESIEPGFYTIGSENIEVGGPHRTRGGRTDSPFNGRWITRAVGGSTAASHTSGATLTRYYPDAPGSSGSSGVTVDNGTDAPASVTTLVAPNADVSTPGQAVLNGGIITQPVDIQADTPTALKVRASSSAGDNLTAGTEGVQLSADPATGNTTLSVTASSLTYQDENGDIQVDIEAGYTTIGGGGTGPTVFPAGQLIINAVTAPADADLGAGQCGLWFDQTNGAAKLMVKAKQADGTVVTGSVDLA